MFRLINADCLNIDIPECKCIFADPPDNIGLRYLGYDDSMDEVQYCNFLYECIEKFTSRAQIVWLSFNAKWLFPVCSFVNMLYTLESRMCIQTYTFGNYNDHDFTNCYRPLLLLKQPGATIYPDAIRVRSRRQEIGDNRADPRGRVPGDVFDFPRVVGNAKERRKWHPTQLNEELVRRCLMYSTVPGDLIVDPFAGTGTVMRMSQLLGRPNLSIEISPNYCENIAFENSLTQVSETEWFADKLVINVVEHYFG